MKAYLYACDGKILLKLIGQIIEAIPEGQNREKAILIQDLLLNVLVQTVKVEQLRKS